MAKRNKVAALVASACKVPSGDYVAFGRSVAKGDIKTETERLGRIEWLRGSLGKAPTAEAIEQARAGHEAGYLLGWATVARTAKIGDTVASLPVEEMARWAAVPKGTKGLPMLATAMLAAARNANRVAWSRLMDAAYPDRVQAREATAAPAGKAKGRPRKTTTAATATTEAAPTAQGVPTVPMICETLRAMWATFTTEERTKLVEAVGQTFRVLAAAAKAGKAQKAA